MKNILYIIYKIINFSFWAIGVYAIANLIDNKYKAILIIPLILYTFLWLIIQNEKENKKL